MMPLLDRLLPDVLQRLDERHTIVRDGANAILTTVKSIWTADVIVAALIKVVEINHSKVRAATPTYLPPVFSCVQLCSVVCVWVFVCMVVTYSGMVERDIN